MDRDQPTEKKAAAPGNGRAGVMMSRRRFARAGLSGSVVLGSLVSKPVLGATPYQCTVSGQISGNLSRADDAVVCVVGQLPSYWLSPDSEWPSPFIKGSLPDHKCRFGKDDKNRGTNFNGFAYEGSAPLANVFFNEKIGSKGEKTCSVTQTSISNSDSDSDSTVSSGASSGSFTVTSTPTSVNLATMLQVLDSMDNGDEDMYLGGVLVTSLLNAASQPGTYPVSIPTIIEMGNAAFGGVGYAVADTKTWDRNRVIEYLESLYQPLSG